MKTTTKLEVVPRIETFMSLVKEGAKKWQQAGELLVQMVDRDQQVFGKILAKYPDMTMDMLRVFERIGQKKLHPMLFLVDSTAAKRASLLPYNLQKEIVENGVRVASGPRAVETKRIDQLRVTEAAKVFDGNRIRTPEEQLRWQNETERERERQRLETAGRYHIHGHKISFYKYSTFTRGELEQILEEWPEESAESIQDAIQKRQIARNG